MKIRYVLRRSYYGGKTTSIMEKQSGKAPKITFIKAMERWLKSVYGVFKDNKTESSWLNKINQITYEAGYLSGIIKDDK